MKAIKIREFLEWAYENTKLSPTNSALIKELSELERLAEIGRATEKAYNNNLTIQNNWFELFTIKNLLDYFKED